MRGRDKWGRTERRWKNGREAGVGWGGHIKRLEVDVEKEGK